MWEKTFRKMIILEEPKVDIRPPWIQGCIQAIKLQTASSLNSFT